jgi:hypothetical protein
VLLLLELLDTDDDDLLLLAGAGGVESSADPCEGAFWSEGFWADGFWSDGFWCEGEAPPQLLASLGAAPYKRVKRRKHEDDDEITEAISIETVSRIRGELAASITAEAIKTARRRSNEALILLLM